MSIREVDVDELEPLLSAGARLLDVREPTEYAEGHVPGAVLVPLGAVPANLDAFRGDGPAFVICRTGARSMRACQFLAEHDIEAVNVEGGTMAWILSGKATVCGDQPA